MEVYSLEIKYSRLVGSDIRERVREMEMRMTELEDEAYMCEEHISVLKLAFGEIMFESSNYENSALYVAEAFTEKAKYGNNMQLKEILKTNVMISLLINNPELRRDEKYNCLYHEISQPFKPEKDIQALIGLAEAYERTDIQQFEHFYQAVDYHPQHKQYEVIHELLTYNLKQTRLRSLLHSYSKVRLDFLSKRLAVTSAMIEKMVYGLIVDSRICGRIGEDKSGKYLHLFPRQDEFLTIQEENLKELAKRYLSAY